MKNITEKELSAYNELLTQEKAAVDKFNYYAQNCKDPNLKKLCKLFCGYQNLSYLCTRKRLGYGVMVTLQILVLPFLVRVRVAQQKRSR